MRERAEKTIKNLIELIWGFSVDVVSDINERGIDLKIVCDKNNLPMLVGKRGRNIRLIRRLMRIWGSINKCNVNIQKL